MGTSRPSARVRLTVRIDEGADSGLLALNMQRTTQLTGPSVLDTSAASIAQVTDALSANRQARKALESISDKLSTSDYVDRVARLNAERFRLQKAVAPDAQQQRPDGLVFADDDDLIALASVTPVKAKIRRNGIREADEADIELNARDVPFDPRMIRSMFVDVTMGLIQPDDYERGVSGDGSSRREDGSPYSVIESPHGQELIYKSGTRFVGFASELEVGLDTDGDVVTIKARDLTQMLVAPRFVPDGGGIDLALPIRVGVQELINSFEATAGLRVFYGNPSDETFGSGEDGPVPKDLAPKALWTRKAKAHKHKRPGHVRVSVWDHITDVCVGIGLVPMIRGFSLYLIQPRTFFQNESKALRMAYGQNLTTWKLGRKFAREKVPTIQVRCYDPDIGRSRWGQYPVPDGAKSSGVFGDEQPPKPQRVNEVQPGGKAEETVSVYTVRGISDGKTLAEAARSIFEQVGRREIEGTIETVDVTSLASDDPNAAVPEEGDLLNLQAGDPIQAVVAPLNAASTGDATDQTPGGSITTSQQISGLSPGARHDFLVRLGYTDADARKIANAYQRTQLLTVFRVHSAEIEFTAKEGFRIVIGFQNFLVIREAPDAGERQETPLVSLTTAGQTTQASQKLRQSSSAATTANAQAASGALTPDQYQEQAAQAAADQRMANIAHRKGG